MICFLFLPITKKSIRHYDNGESVYYIAEKELQRYLLYERSYLSSEFPNGIEIIDGRLFEANVLGLYTCSIDPFGKLYAEKMLWDTPFISVNGGRQRGLVCSAGVDGLFWLPSINNSTGIKHISAKQSISSSFCSPGIYSHSSDGGTLLFLRDHRNYRETPISGSSLFAENFFSNHSPCLTWCWKNNFFIAKEHSLQIFEFLSKSNQLSIIKDVHFWGWKGSFVSAGTTDCGTIVELDHAICLFENWDNQEGGYTIMEPVTNWRFYPRSKTYFNHAHIIFDNRMDIIIMNGTVPTPTSTRWHR